MAKVEPAPPFTNIPFTGSMAGLDWSMHLIDPAKKDSKWAYDVVQYLYGNMRYYWSYRGYKNWNDMYTIREYSDGIQNPDIYKQEFDPQYKQERTGTSPIGVAEYMGLNWRIVSPIPKYRRILEDRLNKIDTEIDCKATDINAMNKKQQAALNLQIQGYINDILKQMSDKMRLIKPMTADTNSKLGRTKVNTDALNATLQGMQFDFQNDYELQIYMDNLFKLKEEIANEIVLKTILELNQIDRIAKILNRNLVDYSFTAARVYRDKNTMFPKIEPLDISRIMLPSSNRNDKKDIGGWGYYDFMSLNKIIETIGDELSIEDIAELYEFATTASGIGSLNSGYTTPSRERLTAFDFERVKLPIIYVEFLSQNCTSAEYSKTRFGTMRAKVVPFDYSTKDKAKTVKQHWGQVCYCGYYVAGYGKLLGFKKLENQIRDEGNPQLCKFSGIFYEAEIKSLVEQMIPHADQIQRCILKMQHAVIMSRPPGIDWNVDAISNVILGNSEITPKTIMKMYQQTGSSIHRSLDENGNAILANGQLAHTLMPNGLADETMAGYWGEIAHHLDMIEKIIGYSPSMAGDPSDPRISAAATKIAAAASDNATFFLYQAAKWVMEDIATITNTHIQEIIKEKGKAYESLKGMVSEQSLEAIEALDELPLHRMGIFMKEKMSDDDKKELETLMAAALEKGQITISDILVLKLTDNYKEAYLLLNLKIKKAAEAQSQQQQQGAQMAMQEKEKDRQHELAITQIKAKASVDVATITGDKALQLQELKAKGNYDSELVRNDLKKEQIELKGEFDVQKEIVKAQNKPEAVAA